MNRRHLLTISVLFASYLLSAQALDPNNFRTITGVSNNLEHTEWGAINTPLLQFTDLGFADGYAAVGGTNRPNPREISNRLFAQGSSLLNDPTGLSDFTFIWGQFIDHDLGLTSDGPEPLFIQVPAGDPFFDPFGAGMAIIPMHRNAFDPASGTGPGNPRRFLNEITAFLDGSGVYGSDEARASWLRTFVGGKLKVSAGNLLPYNTVTGEFGDPIDPTAPSMANNAGPSQVIFVAGDVRASENPLLASIHTLFVREHNRQCDFLAEKHPDWTDEQLYQYARKFVSGFIQSIVYDEWLPAMGVELTPYSGYQPTVNPQMMNIFTAAAFRMGHTLLNSNILRLDGQGNVIPQGNMSLRDAFFNPYPIQESGGIDPFLKGMAVQVQQKFDAKVIDDVRNFLFGQPGFGGLDLVSININRGRERGLPDYNTVRENFGLSHLNFFQQINPDAGVFAALQVIYGGINKIDPWVGMLAERPVTGSIFGPTVLQIMRQQFTALRDGDRFYYWNDPVLTEAEKTYIHELKLRDIIMYNTNINLMQDDVFGALPQAEICDNMTISLTGLVRTATNVPVTNVSLELTGDVGLDSHLTASNGQYTFAGMPFCDLNLLLPSRNDDPLNGVSTFDIILIQKHILGVERFTSPYQYIAADVNASRTITTIDLIRLRKVILNIDTDFGENTSWRFVLGAFRFPEGVDPLTVEFPEWLDFQSAHANNYDSGFIAVKIGDVNNSVDPDNVNDTVQERYLPAGLALQFEDGLLAVGEEREVVFNLRSTEALLGWQFELQLAGATLLDVQTDWPAEYWHQTDRALRMSWNTTTPASTSGQIKLRLRANQPGRLQDIVFLAAPLAPRAYLADGTELAVVLDSKGRGTEKLQVFQNEPNPFHLTTRIPFVLPVAQEVVLTITDVNGRVVYQQSRSLPAGEQTWLLDSEAIHLQGVYYYQIQTPAGSSTRTLIAW